MGIGSINDIGIKGAIVLPNIDDSESDIYANGFRIGEYYDVLHLCQD